MPLLTAEYHHRQRDVIKVRGRPSEALEYYQLQDDVHSDVSPIKETAAAGPWLRVKQPHDFLLSLSLSLT